MRRLMLGLAFAISTLLPNLANADDQAIARFIMSKLQVEQQRGALKGFHVDMRVDQGTVWYKGFVSTDTQKTLILRTAQKGKHLGVKQIVDDISVRANNASTPTPAVPPPGMETQAMEAAAMQAQAKRAQAMQTRGMEQPAMEAQAMQRQAMQQQAMQQQAMERQAMERQAMERQAMERQAMERQAMERQAMERQAMQQQAMEQRAREARAMQAKAMEAQAIEAQTMQPTPAALHAEQTGYLQEDISVRTQPRANTPHPRANIPSPQMNQNFQAAPRAIQTAAPRMNSIQGNNQPMPIAMTGVAQPVHGDSASVPGYAWPSYAAHPNYGAVTYPQQYSPTAWPYIGPFYPYPQVPLGWRKVTMEWDDGWWWLDFHNR